MHRYHDPVVAFNRGFFRTTGSLGGTALILWTTYRVGYLKGANKGRTIEEIIEGAEGSFAKLKAKADEWSEQANEKGPDDGSLKSV